MIGQNTANVANLLSGYGQLDAAQQQQLATILANLATGGATQQANLQGQIGQAKAAGLTGASNSVKDTAASVAKAIAGFG